MFIFTLPVQISPLPEEKMKHTINISYFLTFPSQNGKPYILSMQAGPSQGAVLAQGYNFVTKSVFSNADDMKFYEVECEGHQAYKVFLKENAPVEGILACCFVAGVSWSL